MGCIYILTNPSFPEYVKLGYADDLEKRLKSLNHSECMPFAFRVYAIYEVEKRLKDLDLHALIDKLNPELRSIDEFDGKPRVREFYAMSAEDAYDILECIAKISGTEDKLKRMKPEGHEILDEEMAEEINDIAGKNKEISQNGKDRIEYWTALHEYIKKYTKADLNKEFTAIGKPYPDCWITFSLGTTKYHLNVVRMKRDSSIRLEITVHDKLLYNQLVENQKEIQNEFEICLDYDERENARYSVVSLSKTVDLFDKTNWNEQFEWILDNILILKKIVKKYL